MINNGNIAEAAMHHHNSTFATKNKARMKMVVYNPERYLNEQGFSTPTTAKPTNRGVATNVEAKTDLKPAAPKSRKTRLEQAFTGIMETSDAPVIPAHRTPSAFTAPSPEAASEYEAKLAAQSAGKGRGR
jgi:hypothetical protein